MRGLPARFTFEARPPHVEEVTIRAFVVSLIGIAALAAGLIALRQHKEEPQVEPPPGEQVPQEILLDRIRAAGI